MRLATNSVEVKFDLHTQGKQTGGSSEGRSSEPAGRILDDLPGPYQKPRR